MLKETKQRRRVAERICSAVQKSNVEKQRNKILEKLVESEVAKRGIESSLGIGAKDKEEIIAAVTAEYNALACNYDDELNFHVYCTETTRMSISQFSSSTLLWSVNDATSVHVTSCATYCRCAM